MDHFSDYLRNLRNLRGRSPISGPPPQHLGALRSLDRFTVSYNVKFTKQDAINAFF